MDLETKITALLTELERQNFSTTAFRCDLNKLEEFTNLLLKWNNSHDLVSQKSFWGIFDHHILDSIAAFIVNLHIPSAEPVSYLDIGSGAGLPGIVWHLCFGERSETILIEPREKRINFLKEVRRKLKLENIDFIAERFTELPNKNDKSIATIRALKPNKLMLEEICLKGNSKNCLIWLGSDSADLEIPAGIKLNKIDYTYNLDMEYKRSILRYERA